MPSRSTTKPRVPIGASSMYAWQFSKALHVVESNGWTRFVTMQNYVNLLYREEKREMLPLCESEGIGVIPWSPLARGRRKGRGVAVQQDQVRILANVIRGFGLNVTGPFG